MSDKPKHVRLLVRLGWTGCLYHMEPLAPGSVGWYGLRPGGIRREPCPDSWSPDCPTWVRDWLIDAIENQGPGIWAKIADAVTDRLPEGRIGLWQAAKVTTAELADAAWEVLDPPSDAEKAKLSAEESREFWEAENRENH